MQAKSGLFQNLKPHQPCFNQKVERVSVKDCVTKAMMYWLNSPLDRRPEVGVAIVDALHESGYMVLSTRELDSEIALAHEAGLYDAAAKEEV